MWLKSDQFENDRRIPDDNALSVPADEGHVTFANNKNPHLSWGDVPEGARSFALSMIDVDVPTEGDDVNQEGREVPPDLPRTDFTHWLLVDIPPDRMAIDEAEFSDGVVPRGKEATSGRPRAGVNDYTGWFAGDDDMAGTYHGYDGPCPPWNDSIVHHYVFTLYALDVESLDLGTDFDAADLDQALEGHILATATLTGTYSLNPRLIPG
jgi:Raf kinase inhibitor-like YbhB/YbcL family protein